jgi:hypothetical protein
MIKGLAESILNAKGFGEAMTKAGMAAKEAILRFALKEGIDELNKGLKDLFKQITGLEFSFVNLGKTIAKVLGIGGKSAGSIADTVGDVPLILNDPVKVIQGIGGAAGVAKAGAGAAASAGLSSMSGILSLASLGVDIAAGITNGIQNARMTSLLSGIELSTRAAKEQLVGGIQTALNEWLPWQKTTAEWVIKLYDALAGGRAVTAYPEGTPEYQKQLGGPLEQDQNFLDKISGSLTAMVASLNTLVTSGFNVVSGGTIAPIVGTPGGPAFGISGDAMTQLLGFSYQSTNALMTMAELHKSRFAVNLDNIDRNTAQSRPPIVIEQMVFNGDLDISKAREFANAVRKELELVGIT